jgi:ATP-dependent HslUV protease ATP-binding subunit HslU
MEEMGINLKEMLSNVLPTRTKRRRVRIAEARRLLAQEEAQKLVDPEEAVGQAVRRVENSGIVFLDELDKIAGREGGHGPDVSREGVQRDLLPIVEGSTVVTRYGPVRTDHVLFIAAGAFSTTRPSELMPELQGRFPLRAELKALGKEDFVRILTEPKNAMLKQARMLLDVEEVRVEFTKDAIEEMAACAAQANSTMQDIGARRLHTIVEKVVEDLSFQAPDIAPTKVSVNAKYVRERVKSILESEDLKKYIL